MKVLKDTWEVKTRIFLYYYLMRKSCGFKKLPEDIWRFYYEKFNPKKALIKNLAKEKEINAQILLRNYMLERLLERISSSEYKGNFILKGGMLVAALVGVDMRSTIDMDATIKSFPVSEESIEPVVNEILAVPL